MTDKNITVTARRTTHPTVKLEIELPELSDESAAAIADVLVQLYHHFEAAYYAQILSHHADHAHPFNVTASARNKRANADPF
ncbi:MAG: hypothetical protein O3B24_09835 [Verrucomicrobia bacterium]|nr:hypothetical protein [Verrucomicrobiota bacterium]